MKLKSGNDKYLQKVKDGESEPCYQMLHITVMLYTFQQKTFSVGPSVP